MAEKNDVEPATTVAAAKRRKVRVQEFFMSVPHKQQVKRKSEVERRKPERANQMFLTSPRNAPR
jgi:hypothetical protein